MRLWNQTKKNKSKAQATTELAICATLIIAIFAAILRYSMSMNFQQQVQMEAFRKAMKLSRNESREISYTIVRDKKGVNPFDFFGVPEENRVMASATVAWLHDPFDISEIINFINSLFKDKAPDRTYENYQINNELHKISPIHIEISTSTWFPGLDTADAWVQPLVLETQYRRLRDVDADMAKTENPAGITNRRSYNLSRHFTTKLVYYDKADMEAELLRRAQEEKSRDKEARAEMYGIFKEALLDILSYVGLSLGDVSGDAFDNINPFNGLDVLTSIISSASEDIDYTKIVLYVVLYYLTYIVIGYIGANSSITSVEIIDNTWRASDTFMEQGTWSGSSEWTTQH